jgi:hypothetical protein
MKCNSTILLFWLIIGQLAAQQTNNYGGLGTSASVSDELKRLNSNITRMTSSFDNRYEGVKGSPFLFESWAKGRLVLADSVRFNAANYQYKFNVIDNELWVMDTTHFVMAMYNHAIKSLEIQDPANGQLVVFKKYRAIQPDDPGRFYVSLYHGKQFAFAKDLNKKFKTADLVDRGIVSTGEASDRFEEENRFYLGLPDGHFVPLNLKKKDLIELLPSEKKEKATLFCKEHGYRGKMKAAEIIALLQWLEQ